MTIDWTLFGFFLGTAAAGFWAGSRWAAMRIGLRIQKAIDEGSVLPWSGKAYVISRVPHMPDFPAFQRRGQPVAQKGNPSGVDE